MSVLSFRPNCLKNRPLVNFFVFLKYVSGNTKPNCYLFQDGAKKRGCQTVDTLASAPASATANGAATTQATLRENPLQVRWKYILGLSL